MDETEVDSHVARAVRVLVTCSKIPWLENFILWIQVHAGLEPTVTRTELLPL